MKNLPARYKRITCFITSLSSGGAEHQIVLLSGLLAEKGYDVTLTTFADYPDHYEVADGVKRHRIKHGKGNVSKIFAIWRYFLTVETDCVISFGARENFFCLVPLFFRRKIKVLAGERCATWGGLTWYKKLNYYCLYRRADYIVPNSYTQQEEISTSWPQYKKKTHAVTNYTDADAYKPSAQPNNSPLKIGIFSRYSEQKNYRRFAHVVKLLKDSSNLPFEMHWYGNKHREGIILPEYITMEDLRKNYQIEGNLILHDHIQDVSSEIKKYDALCLPSYTEGFSNSISEYICSARPVLCSDVADNKVMVHDGENGFLFDPYDEDSMVGAFEKFFSLTMKERETMGVESRKIAEGLFSKELFIAEYINMIEA